MSETEVKVLRQEIKNYVDRADERSLRMLFAMLEADTEEDGWNNLPQEVQASINKGIIQADSGQVIGHGEFLKKHEKWFPG